MKAGFFLNDFRKLSKNEDVKNLFLVIFLAFILATPVGIHLAKKTGKITFAHGLSYFGPPEKVINFQQASTSQQPTSPTSTPATQTAAGWQKVSSTEQNGWITVKGQFFPYLLSIPNSLNLQHFLGDQNDSIGIATEQKPAHQNLLLFVEAISNYDKNLKGKPEEFVKNYWTFYSGLDGIKDLEKYTNKKGFLGYKARYLIKDSKDYNFNIFFLVKGDENHLVHLLKGDLDEKTFNEIAERFEFASK